MRIAIFKLFNIGDALLLTPTLTALRKGYPNAEITVVTRETNLGILQGCPAIDHLVGMSDPREPGSSALLHDIRAILNLRRTRFDYLFELSGRQRGRNLAALCRTCRAYSVRTIQPLSGLRWLQFDAVAAHDCRRGHLVERDFFSVHEFLPLPTPIPPLVFDRKYAQAWSGANGLDSFAVLQVGTREGFKRWHAAGWRKLAQHLLERLPNLVVTSGAAADEVAEAEALHDYFGSRIILTRGKTTWPELADLLYRTTLYVGLDTSVTHLAAACQCPIVALFGPTVEEIWEPWQAQHHMVTTRDFHITEEDRQSDGYPAQRRRRMSDILAEDVIAACDEILKNGPVSTRVEAENKFPSSNTPAGR